MNCEQHESERHDKPTFTYTHTQNREVRQEKKILGEKKKIEQQKIKNNYFTIGTNNIIKYIVSDGKKETGISDEMKSNAAQVVNVCN